MAGDCVQGVGGDDRAGDVGDQVQGGGEVEGLVRLVVHLALSEHHAGVDLVDAEQMQLQALAVAGAADGLAVRRKPQHGQITGDARERVGRVGLHERADGGTERIGVSLGERAGAGGGHRQLAGVAIGDLEGSRDADASATRPADHAAHRAHPAQRGAGDHTEQHRPGVRDQVRRVRAGSGTARTASSSYGSRSGVHNSSPTRARCSASRRKVGRVGQDGMRAPPS
ncbi:hypothetical protein OG568_52685 (plasmid) [Streptomyces sp. NBC_01450]|uniref:hypothetical protein n=1 Tax=Streptomyces sp. NBC_01450 TaxID=2903871 RepID=UPI002E36D2F9|nr:hypothetical protein [Streptomyces sp. NBC_01450]